MRARLAAWLLQKRSKIRRLLLTARPILYAFVENRLKYIFLILYNLKIPVLDDECRAW